MNADDDGGSKTRVVLDARAATSQLGGVARYARALADTIPRCDATRRYIYYCWPSRFQRWRPSPPRGLSDAPRRPLVCSPVPGRITAFVNGRLGRRVPRFFWGGAHIFHSFDFIPEFFRSVATIATVHDVTFLNVPEVYIDHTFPRLLDAGLRRTLPLCEAVITVSQQSKSDIVEHYGYPAERVYVAYNWVSDELLTASSRQALLPAVCDRPYILSVGTVQPNKNYHTTIEAFARLAGKLPHTYVIAGRSDFGPAYTRQLQQRIAELGLSDRIHFLGAVDDALLAALYRNAGLLLFPSYHEGFGFPLIEAMHFGVPIVTSNAGSMPEVACDAALQVTPTDIVAMAEAIEAAVTDDSVRARLLAAARLGRNRFSKDRAVRTVLGVYDSIL